MTWALCCVQAQQHLGTQRCGVEVDALAGKLGSIPRHSLRLAFVSGSGLCLCGRICYHGLERQWIAEWRAYWESSELVQQC